MTEKTLAAAAFLRSFIEVAYDETEFPLLNEPLAKVSGELARDADRSTIWMNFAIWLLADPFLGIAQLIPREEDQVVLEALLARHLEQAVDYHDWLGIADATHKAAEEAEDRCYPLKQGSDPVIAGLANATFLALTAGYRLADAAAYLSQMEGGDNDGSIHSAAESGSEAVQAVAKAFGALAAARILAEEEGDASLLDRFPNLAPPTAKRPGPLAREVALIRSEADVSALEAESAAYLLQLEKLLELVRA